jgi:hypothetical protein
MNINPVDEFRNKFFEALIKEEQEKEKAIALAQKKCFHNYDIINYTNQNGYQERTCSKCNHTAIKSIRVWSATKTGNCTIA